MKIAVTSAFGWPYVRRGNRVVYELASYLAAQGNEVHFITTKPGDIRREKARGNLLIKYYPVIDNPFLTHFNVEYWQTFALSCLSALLKEDYDIVHTSLTMDAFAASLNMSFKGTPFIPVLINGDPLYTDALRARRLFRRAVKKASRLVTISNFVNDILKRDFGVEGVMIPCPVDTSKFYYIEKERTGPPRILCTATPIMARKRVPLLVKAFETLLEHIPDAILQLAGETTPEVTERLLMTVNEKTRASIEVVNITSDEVLASYYRNAAITVLPSIKEPFGMVTTESLASGTPVVGTRSGGTAEILRDPRIGVMFEPADGPEELCQALMKCVELARDPETSKRCSEYAQQYSWNALGPKYEELHRDVLSSAGRNLRARKKLPEKGRHTQVNSRGQVSFNGRVDDSLMDRLFVDTLDELEITAQRYYQIESCRPRCVSLLKWMLAGGIRQGKVLVTGASIHFLATLLMKLDFSVKYLEIKEGTDDGDGYSDREVFQDMRPLVDLQEHFEVIICDDIPTRPSESGVLFQVLRKNLSPEGVLIVTAPNVRQGTGRPGTPADIEKAAKNSGFMVIQRSFIRGEKHIYKTNAFARVPLKTYLVQKLHGFLESIDVSPKSHLLMVLKEHQQENRTIAAGDSGTKEA